VRNLLGGKLSDDECDGDFDATEPASSLFLDDEESILVRCTTKREQLPLLLVKIGAESKTTDEKLACKICDESFMNSIELEHHVTQCRGGLFVCDICDKAFRLQKSLAKHKHGHSGTHQTLSCPECGKMLATRSTLREHLRWHEGLPRVSCQLCGKMLASEESRRKHVKAVHEKVKPHACEHCDYRYCTYRTGHIYHTRYRLVPYLESFFCLKFLRLHLKIVQKSPTKSLCPFSLWKKNAQEPYRIPSIVPGTGNITKPKFQIRIRMHICGFAWIHIRNAYSGQFAN
jgi:hypothetical protein